MYFFRFQMLSLVVLAAILFWSCSNPDTSKAVSAGEEAVIFPDYTDITVPPNIAPLNFRMENEGSRFVVRFVGENGYTFSIKTSKTVTIPAKKWRRLLKENIGKTYQIRIYRKHRGQWEKFPTITNTISTEPIDPYLIYRFIHPGYETSGYLRIQQRHLESFKSSDIINSSLMKGSCMNCHLTNWGNPDEFVVHFRFRNSGTIVYKDGEFRRLNTVTQEFINPGIHPAWHPSGRFIAFSTNTAELYFHYDVFKRTESYDSKGNIALFDLETNTMLGHSKLMTPDPIQETFPCWSPDGKWLYFCRTSPPAFIDTLPTIEQQLSYIKYDLLRISFDERTISFGEIETVVDSDVFGKSVSLPRVSPDGRFITFVAAHRGTFTVWKKDADLWILDRQTMEKKPLTEANSDESDSYHSWSSNSRWVVISSKRRDGLVALPYFSHIDKNGNATKPFLLPQKNPNFYDVWIQSFNIPELVRGRTTINIYDYERAIKGPVTNVRFGWANSKSKPSKTQ